MNGFILVFGMVLVLAVERRFAADRAAAGGPARSRQSRPVAGCSSAAVRPCSRCPPAADGPARGRRQSRGRVPGRSPMAKCSRNAFPSVRPWQDIAAVRSRAAIRGSFFTSCVPEGASDGKSVSSRQDIAAMHPKRAGFGKIFAPCIRKAPQTAV